MYTFLLVVHAIIAAALVTVILVQRSEGGGLGVGGSPTGLMSARGAADFLTRATGILAGVFIVMSIGLAALATIERGSRDIDTSLARRAPATPAGPTSDVPLANPTPGVGAPAAAPAAEGVPGLPVLPAGDATKNAEAAEKNRADTAALTNQTAAPAPATKAGTDTAATGETRRERRRRNAGSGSDSAPTAEKAPAAESAPPTVAAPAPSAAPNNTPPANDTPAPAAQ